MSYANIIFSGFDFVLLQIILQEHYCPRKSVNILAKRHILNSLTIV